MVKPEAVLAFWLDEVTPDQWYQSTDDLDQEIRDRFGAAWETANHGGYGLWLTYPSGALAYAILTDQFPRNMFRGSANSFKLDHLARSAATLAISHGWDLKIDEPARQFFYLPLMHSENLCDQDRCVRLMKERMTGTGNLLHACVHREIIRRFGRFPYRNAALGRTGTAGETAFVETGGYKQVLDDLKRKLAA